MSDNETLTDQSHAEQGSKIRKRKSSIFQVTRRLKELDITKNDDDNDSEKKNENSTDEEPFDLPAYIEGLRNERKAWKDTLRERKSRRRQLQREKSVVEKQGADYDLSVLSEAERSFVLARPPYEDIAKNINKLTEEAIKVVTLGQEIQNMRNRMVLMMEKKLADMTKKIIEMSCEET